jgi:prepilin-type N-terminal cleavage/methylation domain-containing protein
LGFEKSHRKYQVGEKMLTKIRKIVQGLFRRGEKGFTLMEVVISMAIFATGLLMMVPMIVTAQKGNVFASGTTKAAHYLQAKMEEIKNTHNFTSGQDTPEGMTRRWTVENVNTFLEKITLEMVWVDKDSLEHHNVTVTYESHN